MNTAVHSVHEFAFCVPDLEAAVHFYSSFGLDVRREAGGLGLYTDGHAQRWGRVLEGGRKQLLWLALGVYQQDLAALLARCDAQQVRRIAPPHAEVPDGVWIAAPDGVAICLQVAAKCSPSEKAPREFAPEGGHAGRAPCRSAIRQVRPTHLSHILLFTPDVNAAVEFYCAALGLRLSDRSGDIIAFVHSPHGSDHHLLAFARSAAPGLHHSSWNVNSFDAVGLGAQQMAQAGYPDGWGVGRHVLGSNYFRYVRDPWGSYAEYSFDIDFIAAGVQWPAADYPPEDSLYVWGPALPADFVTNHEVPTM
ncbi:catechol 2,3-dioxygenase [Duganella sp. CF402]|uniref:VOC family protein n=1 Tax=unclassified Duganella TaxID=2636909 RepID=UPI0008B2E23A|nr:MULTISPECIES: VOC family protein [unclassified Duganella]RZT08843.1 catechol 2,3-dioxygenase [Duganella sp. BK701]SEL79798.1 catechol 2,3-dioxygenase [Duganella sp. CF402]